MKIRIVNTQRVDWLYITNMVSCITNRVSDGPVRIKKSRVSVLGTYMTSRYMLTT